jgi:hypothetical protein
MRSLFLSLALCVGIFSLQAQDTGYHRAKIFYTDAAELVRLQEMGVGVDHGRYKRGVFFESDFSAAELAIVAAAGMDYEVVIKDVDRFYVDRNDPRHPAYVKAAEKNADCGLNPLAGITVPANYNEGSMGGFLTYAEMLAELDEMYAYCQANGLDIMTPRADNVNPADPEDFKTAQGRYQQWVKISDDAATDDDAEPEIFYSALHHAREPASMQQLIFYMWYLIENYTTSDEVQSIVDNTELYFIPCLNPDGYLYNEQNHPNGGGFWRKNRRGGYGVDLNRNYSYITPAGEEIWNTTGVSSTRSGGNWPGVAPFSEPETRAVRYFVENHQFTVALNNHTSGGLLLYPFGYDLDQYTPDNGYFEQLSEAMVRDNGYVNQLSADLYPASGDSDDFMYGMLTTNDGGTREKVFAMTPEIGEAFWPARNEIEGICREMLRHNLTAARALGNFGVVEETTGAIVSSRNFDLTYNLTRLGFKDGAMAVSLEPVSSNLVGVGPEVGYAALSQGERTNGRITLTISPAATQGEEIVFDLVLDNGIYAERQRITKIFGSPETVFGDAADDLVGWTTSTWGISTTVFHPDSPSASLTDSPNGNYANDAVSRAELNAGIDLTDANIQAVFLRFYARWDIEDDYDQVQVEISPDDGASWIPQCGRYTSSGAPDQISPGEPVYDGVREEWVLEEIDLSDYLGQTVRLRFEISSDRRVNGDGFYVDQPSVDVIRRFPAGTAAPLTEPVEIAPNPVADVLSIATELGDYDCYVTDLLGRKVVTKNACRGNATLNLAHLPAGVYQLEVRAGARRRTFKVVRE